MRRNSLIGAVLMVAVIALFSWNVWSTFATHRPATPPAISAPAPMPAIATSNPPASVPSLIAALSRFSSNEAVRAGLALRLAEYWDALPDQIVQCRLCPRKCTIPPGYRGACRARVNIDGSLRTLVYGRVVSRHVDPIEKKPLFHLLPGTKSFSIATAGCNMNCVFCQNWQIAQAKPEETVFVEMSPKDVVDAAVESGSKSIAYTYTEPTIYFEFMRDTAKLAKAAGIKNVWITCGFIEEAPLRELCGVLDAANVDLKGFSAAAYRDYTSGQLEPILRTLKVLKEQGVWVEIGNLVIPGANDSPAELSNLCAWVATEMGKDTPLHFLRFFPNNKLTDRPPTPIPVMESAVKLAKAAGLHYVYTGNIPGNPYESTCCPKCGKVVVKRIGYMIGEINVKAGACAHCNAPIAGRW